MSDRNTLHRPIHAAGIYLNPAFSYSCGSRCDAEVMDGFFSCVQRMVPNPQERADISKEMEIIGWLVEHLALTWLLMIGRPKCQVSFKFILLQISMSLLHLFQTLNFQCYFFN